MREKRPTLEVDLLQLNGIELILMGILSIEWNERKKWPSKFIVYTLHKIGLLSTREPLFLSRCTISK